MILLQFPPYVMKYNDSHGEIRLHGLMAGLFTNITASLNLSYMFVPFER